ncbi:MAG: phage major capsid protein [Clostridiales Family XIII bacterium]|jgi:HK97 family phage major capsid protein|nr:phage major capsid protein [Clostridiales Family XIII bacterium]
MKNYLNTLLAARRGKLEEVKAQGRGSADAEEVRALLAQAAEIEGEIRGAQEQLDGIEAREAQEAADASAAAAALAASDRQAEENGRGFSPFGANPLTPQARGESLGAYFTREAGGRLGELIGGTGSIALSEYRGAAERRGASDPQLAAPYSLLLNEVDPNVVAGFRRPTVTGLFGQGSISGQSITYYVEGAAEGAPGAKAEGAAASQVHFADPVANTDGLSTIGGFIKFSREMAEDLPFIQSEIDSRLLYMVELARESQVLNGDGASPNLKGLFNRDGLGVLPYANAGAFSPDLVLSAIAQIRSTGLEPDGVVINPADYLKWRLLKDGNGQYLGGGPFANQYGQGGIIIEPPLWATNTVVTPAIPEGTVLVGAFKLGGTVYGKGGIRLEATNSHDEDFVKGLITLRADVRNALAVRKPSAFVKIAQA